MILMPIILTLGVFALFLKIYQLTKWPLLNPLFWSICAIIGLVFLKVFSYEDYKAGTQVISFFLGPATVILALPMYRQRALLKAHFMPILIGIGVSIISSALSITALALLMKVPEALHLSLLPKSITTPIGLSVSETIGGIPALTVVSIILTGILGAIFSPAILKMAKVEHPIAKGIGIGASTHVVGTTKAIEMGEVEGAMSSLSIALAGVGTYLFMPLYLKMILKIFQF